MSLTRKAFLVRTAAATAGVVATSLAGAGQADAIIIINSKQLQSVLELTTNASRQLNRLIGEWPPGPCRQETVAALEAIQAAATDLSASTGRLLGACRS